MVQEQVELQVVQEHLAQAVHQGHQGQVALRELQVARVQTEQVVHLELQERQGQVALREHQVHLV